MQGLTKDQLLSKVFKLHLPSMLVIHGTIKKILMISNVQYNKSYTIYPEDYLNLDPIHEFLIGFNVPDDLSDTDLLYIINMVKFDPHILQLFTLDYKGLNYNTFKKCEILDMDKSVGIVRDMIYEQNCNYNFCLSCTSHIWERNELNIGG